jgi:hypothetical protein
VWLLASNIPLQHPNKKLDHRQYGPFSVMERIGSHAYFLRLPDTMKIHDVFHVSLLTAYKPCHNPLWEGLLPYISCPDIYRYIHAYPFI